MQLFGRDIADQLIWWLISRYGTYLVTKSFCSIFPLWEIVRAPDFEAAIKKASEDYLAKQPAMTMNIPGFDKWLKEN